MLYNRNVFHILEIEPTDDKKTIKKAYAKLVKIYHPEEFPEKWKEIHHAYETALKMASTPTATVTKIENIPIALMTKAENTLIVPTVKTETTPIVPSEKTESTPIVPHTKKAQKDVIPIIKTGHTENEREQNQEQAVAETKEIDILFDNIKKLSEEQKKQNEEAQKQALQKVISQLKELAGKKKLYREEWEDFFYQEDILPLISTREFLRQLGDCFANRKIDAKLHQFLINQLQLIKKYNSDRCIVLKRIGLLDPVGYAESKIDAAYRADMQQREKKHSAPVTIFMVIVLVLLFFRAGVSGYHDNERKIEDSQKITELIIPNNQIEIDEEALNALSESIAKVIEEKEESEKKSQYHPSKNTVDDMPEGEQYRYLEAVKLSYEDEAVSYAFIPKGEKNEIEENWVQGELGGVWVNANILNSLEEKDYFMKSMIDSVYKDSMDMSSYQNLSVGEVLPMTSLEDAEYMTFSCEYIDGQGDIVPNILIVGYYVLEESEEGVKEVVVSVNIFPFAYDETTDEILKELEKAYGFDLHEYYASNFQ